MGECRCAAPVITSNWVVPMQTKDLVGDGIEEQTEQVMKNIGAVLEAAGTSFDKVLKTTVLIMDMGDFAKINAVYGEFR